MKKIIIAGGSGFLGQLLAHHLSKHYQVFILSRTSQSTDYKNININHLTWDGKQTEDWKDAMEGAKALINLSGKSVDCRYNERNKERILASRIQSTHALGEAIRQLNNPPEVWLNASSATIYRHSLDKEMTEQDGEIGHGFSVEVCRAWEKEFFLFNLPRTRQIAMRLSMVLDKSGGVLPPMARLSKLGMGGQHGSGQQYMSWIHGKDFCRFVDFCLENQAISGIYNVTAPYPVPNKVFTQKLRKHAGAPLSFSIPKPLLEIGALILRTETELILKSRRVVPQKLLSSGFSFEFPTLDAAFRNIYNPW